MTKIQVRVIDCHILRWVDGAPEFLLLKRSKKVEYPEIWQCVTGKIEPNELPYQTAIRELKEETNLVPKSMWAIDMVNHFYEAIEDRMNLIPVFGVEVKNSDIILSHEHSEYKWCNIEKATPLLLWKQQKEGLREFHSMLISKDKRNLFTKINIINIS